MTFYIARYRHQERHTFTCEVVTPMFLAGADQTKAELRVPSIKAALRFWWRALYGSDIIKEMKEREGEIFGDTSQKAMFSVEITKQDANSVKENLPRGRNTSATTNGKPIQIGIIDYLAFGIRDHRQGYLRSHFSSGVTFWFSISFFDDSHKKEILEAFSCLVNFSGLGAKSRNGFGSFKILENDILPIIDTNLFKSFTKKFAAFSNKTQVFDNFPEQKSWDEALSDIGIAYRNGRMNLRDHRTCINRLLIAKPIVQVHNNERHAKPYFLHVNKLGESKFKGQILFLPYTYYKSEQQMNYETACINLNQKLTPKP